MSTYSTFSLPGLAKYVEMSREGLPLETRHDLSKQSFSESWVCWLALVFTAASSLVLAFGVLVKGAGPAVLGLFLFLALALCCVAYNFGKAHLIISTSGVYYEAKYPLFPAVRWTESLDQFKVLVVSHRMFVKSNRILLAHRSPRRTIEVFGRISAVGELPEVRLSELLKIPLEYVFRI